jgi:hypothetical protein
MSKRADSFRCGVLRVTTAPVWRWELWHESGERENETVRLGGRATLDMGNDVLWLSKQDTRERGEFATMQEVGAMLSKLPRWTATKFVWQDRHILETAEL